MNRQKTMVNFAVDLLRNDLLEDSNELIPKKLSNDDKVAVKLIVSISQSFFHLMSVNSCRKQTFDYLYDCSKDLNEIRDKTIIVPVLSKMKARIEKKLHLVELPVSHSNNIRVHLNVFNDRCCCEKCLSACYMFDVTHGSDLRYEFVRVLSSEHCRHWHHYWLQTLSQQIFIFLCCIKDGLVNEKLLESAALLAKLLLSKNHTTCLNQMKYSYIYFHLNFMNMVKLKENLNKQVDNLNYCETVVTVPVFKGTGKEELEMIDGIKIISFQSEADMNEYTNLEAKYIVSFSSSTKPIAPTKTNDLTKIKGWKRKLFIINNDITSSEVGNSEIFFYKSKEIIYNGRIKSKTTENYKEATAEYLPGDAAELKFKRVMVDYESGNKELMLNDSSDIAASLISSQLKSSGNHHTLNTTLNSVNRNVFESEALDEFLMNDSRLNISYEIPRLRAAEILTNSNNAVEVNTILKSEHKQLKPKMTDGGNGNFEVSKSPIKVSGVLEGSQTSSASKNKSVVIQTDFSPDEIDVGTEYGDAMKRPRLLPTLFDEEDNCKRKKVERPTSSDFGPTMISFIHKFGLVNIECQCKRLNLGMTLSTTKRTCLSKETVENLQLLWNENDIDKCRDSIISSALSLENRSQDKTIIFPFLSNKVLNSVTEWKERLVLDKITLSVPTLSSSIGGIDCEVISVAKELLNYVERNVETTYDIPFDPMQTRPLSESLKNDKKTIVPKIIRELRKLVNVSVLDESEQRKENRLGPIKLCGNDFCSKGCVCSSLNNKRKIAHCGNFKCMFECSCPYQFRFCRNVTNGEKCLAKEEISWQQHQKVVIRSETGDNIEFVNKSQREPKLPKRFRNDVLMGAEFDNYLRAPNAVTPAERSVIPRWENFKKSESLSKNVNKRRLGFCAGTLTGDQTLADIFIWCAVHDKYNCLCATSLARLNDNTLIWKSNKCSRYLAQKAMFNTQLISNYSQQVYLYDFKKFSARTYGIPFEYAVRNRSETFRLKRKCELEHGVLSFTNSFTKMKFFMVSNRDIIADYELERELGIKEAYRSSENKFIYISNVTDDEDMQIEIIEDHAPVTVDYIDTIDESNDYNCDHVNNKNEVLPAPVSGHEDEDEPNMDDSAAVSGHEDKDEPNMDDSACVDVDKHLDDGMDRLAVDVRHDLDHVIIIVDSDEEKHEAVDNEKQQNYRAIQSKVSLHCSSVDDNNGFRFILPRPRSNNHFFKAPSIKHHDTTAEQSAVNPFKKATPKFKITQRSMKYKKMKDNSQIDLSSRITGNINEKLGVKETLMESSYKYRLEEVDLELETGLIKLEDRPEHNLFRADNFPKLALMCLTPGIGYLPILEFKTDMLLVQDPIICDVYRSFKGLNAANLWLNRFFKNRLIFESKYTNLKWVIVKPGVLKLKKCYPFKVSLLDKSSLTITKDGAITFKGNRESAIRREPIVMKPCLAVDRQQTFGHHLNMKRTNEACVRTGDGINIKRRKVQIEADGQDSLPAAYSTFHIGT